MAVTPLNLFYAEPDPDRWFKYDRYPRKLIRRIVRGKSKPGGVMLIALNLMEGLKRIGVPFRFNDYKYIKNHPNEIACIIGKPHLLHEKRWNNPIIFGAGVFSHPIEAPDLLAIYPNIKKILVPGDWMQTMFRDYYGDKAVAWPVGIDTEYWSPFADTNKESDFLIYDKIRWDHEKYEESLVNPVTGILDQLGLSYQFIRYGNYSRNELSDKLSKSRSVIFLCEHESQGQAYQQILATDTPILAWDRGGYWQDPYYYPHKVKYRPVSSVPYWDDRCGIKFSSVNDFKQKLDIFLSQLDAFKPREYIMENLTLELCARKYLDIFHEVEKEIA